MKELLEFIFMLGIIETKERKWGIEVRINLIQPNGNCPKQKSLKWLLLYYIELFIQRI